MAQAAASPYLFRKSQCHNVAFAPWFVAPDDPSRSGLVVRGPGEQRPGHQLGPSLVCEYKHFKRE